MRGVTPAREQAKALAARAARREPRDDQRASDEAGTLTRIAAEPVALGVERARAPGHEPDHRRELMPKTAGDRAR